MSIPASNLANVIPGVIGAGGAALALTGMMLTANTAVPINTVQNFANAAAVSNFFGPNSDEFALASVYFAGYDNSTQKPGALLFAQYPTAPVAGYLRSASLASVTLAQLQATPSGTLTVVVDGASKTSSTINLSTVTSFSNAASIIAAAFTSGPAVSFDAQRQAFVFTSSTTGATSSVSFATGALSAPLMLTQATGAVTSAGAVAATPAAYMTALTGKALNWAGFMTMFEPVLADKIAFANWNSQQNSRFVYAAWDTDVTATQSGNTASFGPQLAAQGLSGVVALTADTNVASASGVTMQNLVRPLAALTLGYLASLDFTRTNGRTTFAFRGQAGLATGVSDATVAANLVTNGYNFYGNYATSAQQFLLMQPGSVSGRFAWLDSYANEIWMNAAFQQSLLSFMASAGSIPYNVDGYAAIETVLQTPINAALNFGAIRSGVTLSGSQIVQLNSGAGTKIDTVVSSRGWYVQVKDPGPQVRSVRQSPSITLWYCDGGSVQQMTMASLLVQ